MMSLGFFQMCSNLQESRVTDTEQGCYIIGHEKTLFCGFSTGYCPSSETCDIRTVYFPVNITQYCFPNFIAKFNYIKCKPQLETTTRTTQFEFGEKELERCHSELTNPCSLSVCSCWVCGHFTEMTTRQVFQMRPGQIRERARAGAGKENPIQFFIVVAVTVVASSLLACCLHGMNED